MQDKFKLNQIHKTYLALVKGEIQQDSLNIQQPLSTSTQRCLRRKTVVDLHGKAAATHFQVLRRLRDMTLVKVTPKTGRTHQIRVHAATLGYPILGDDRYGDRTFNRQHRQAWGKRLYLHAAGLGLQAVQGLQLQGICIPLDMIWKGYMATNHV